MRIPPVVRPAPAIVNPAAIDHDQDADATIRNKIGARTDLGHRDTTAVVVHADEVIDLVPELRSSEGQDLIDQGASERSGLLDRTRDDCFIDKGILPHHEGGKAQQYEQSKCLHDTSHTQLYGILLSP